MSLTFRVWELLGAHDSAAGWNVPLMRAHFHRIHCRRDCEPGCRSTYRRHRPTRLSDFGLRANSPTIGKFLAVLLPGGTALLLHVVRWFRAFSEWSYRTPGASWLIVCFCRRHSASGSEPVESIGSKSGSLGDYAAYSSPAR